MIPLMLRLVVTLLSCGIVVVGCNLNTTVRSDVASAMNGENVRLDSGQSSPTPEAATAAVVVPSATVEQMPLDPSVDRCALYSDGPIRRVNADLQIDYDTKVVQVAETIGFANREPSPIADIVLDVQANQWDGGFQLAELTVDGAPASWDLNLNRLTIALTEPLMPGCGLEIGLAFNLQPPAIRDGLRAYRGFFGYSPRQLNLGHFLPTVASRLNGDWRIHEPVGIGEQVVHAIADWRVRVAVTNAAESLQMAAPGNVTALSQSAWEVHLINSRDFSISLSDEFIVAEQQTADGITMAVYTFADAMIDAGGLWLDGAAHTLQTSLRALEIFAREYGAYPYERFVLVQGDFPDGMEFTGLVFVGSAWFTNFDGTPYNYLTLISVHEIAHQWWYAQVGNDAALNPWLDEALATYSEYVFIEEYYPADKNWWWTYRVANFFPQGMVDSTVYEFTTARAYINAVYLRGVQMLQNLREDIGDTAFFDMLRAYRRSGDGGIANPMLFWAQLPADQFAATADTRSAFLREPNISTQRSESAPSADLAKSTNSEQSP